MNSTSIHQQTPYNSTILLDEINCLLHRESLYFPSFRWPPSLHIRHRNKIVQWFYKVVDYFDYDREQAGGLSAESMVYHPRKPSVSYEEDSTRGRISFFESQFDCPGIHNGEISANLLFEKETGTLTNMYSNFYPVIEEVQMSPELLRVICHAKCDAVEATPLS